MPHFNRRDLPLLLTAAVCGITINQAAFVGALTLTSTSNVALLVDTIPIWTALVAVGTRQERLGLGSWISLMPASQVSS